MLLCCAGLKVGDIWSEAGPNPDQDWTAPTTGLQLIRTGKRKQHQTQQDTPDAPDSDAVAAAPAGPTAAAAAQPAAKRSKRRAVAPALVPAVEVDAPGCSFNPEKEAHQDALAAAVAAEYKKQLADELAPKAPSQFAPAGYKPQDELEALLVDADVDEDDEPPTAQQLAQLPLAMQDENAITLDDSEDEGADVASPAAPAAGAPAGVGADAAVSGGKGGGRAVLDRKTQKDRNREARRRQQEAEAAAKAALKQQRRELERLGELQEQLQQEEQEKEAVRLRRQVGVCVQRVDAGSLPCRLMMSSP
jgi:hypothetical protein